MAPLVSHLAAKGIVEAQAVDTDKVFDAARLFYKAEGILPAPESAHAVAAVIFEALEAKRLGQETDRCYFRSNGFSILCLAHSPAVIGPI
jgi:tryptophan synthase beta chain